VNYSIESNLVYSNTKNDVKCTSSCTNNLICVICDNVCDGLCPTGLYGTNCSLVCSNCNFGSCNNAQNATIPCSCNTGFDSSLNCSNCVSNNWGSSCSNTCDCNGHGHCIYGITGSGTCNCDLNYDPLTNCEKTLSNTVTIIYWQVPVFVTIGSVAFLAIVISLGFFCVYRKMKDVHEEISIGNNIHSGINFEIEKEKPWEKKHLQVSTSESLYSSN